MIFVINKRIEYNEYEGTLDDIDEPGNTILLTKPACRLLSILVRNNDMLVKRKQLLDEVWEDYGLKATDSNLNNYISGLRRSLATFDETELIITYPRQGFKFIAKKIARMDVKIATSDAESTIEVGIRGGHQPENSTTENDHPHTWHKKWRVGKVLVIGGILLMLFLLLFFYKQLPVNNITNFGQYKNCDIYTIKYNGMEPKEIEKKISKQYSCEDKANVYYYFNIKGNDTSSNESLMLYCPLNTSIACELTYIGS